MSLTLKQPWGYLLVFLLTALVPLAGYLYTRRFKALFVAAGIAVLLANVTSRVDSLAAWLITVCFCLACATENTAQSMPHDA